MTYATTITNDELLAQMYSAMSRMPSMQYQMMLGHRGCNCELCNDENMHEYYTPTQCEFLTASRELAAREATRAEEEYRNR